MSDIKAGDLESEEEPAKPDVIVEDELDTLAGGGSTITADIAHGGQQSEIFHGH